MAEVDEKVRDAVDELGVGGVSKDIRDFADEGLEVIVDFAGFGTTTASAVDAIKHGGRIVQIGLAREEAAISMQQVTLKGITLVGASNGEKSEAEEVLKLMASGNIASKIVPITFEQIPEYVDRRSPRARLPDGLWRFSEPREASTAASLPGRRPGRHRPPPPRPRQDGVGVRDHRPVDRRHVRRSTGRSSSVLRGGMGRIRPGTR
ncbi:zinc-binding dehydrogenase [Streptomyces viridosporus]|uniref:zinc-binding dehydrogenase n=1 Tax=Streptomyces viridosporus TaxID=67581 RepID=UPI003701E354